MVFGETLDEANQTCRPSGQVSPGRLTHPITLQNTDTPNDTNAPHRPNNPLYYFLALTKFTSLLFLNLPYPNQQSPYSHDQQQQLRRRKLKSVVRLPKSANVLQPFVGGPCVCDKQRDPFGTREHTFQQQARTVSDGSSAQTTQNINMMKREQGARV